jgi:DNA repair protein RadC
MTTSTPRLITLETLQALSQEEFAWIRDLVEVEDLRRLTAMPVSYPTPGQCIRTPEQAVQLARESGMSTRYESLIALCLSQMHEALAVYYVYAGQSCPLLLDLDFGPLIQAATACQTQRMIMVSYHPHPHYITSPEEFKGFDRCRLALKHAGMPLYDFVVIDRIGAILSFRNWGQPPEQPAEASGVASDA